MEYIVFYEAEKIEQVLKDLFIIDYAISYWTEKPDVVYVCFNLSSEAERFVKWLNQNFIEADLIPLDEAVLMFREESEKLTTYLGNEKLIKWYKARAPK